MWPLSLAPLGPRSVALTQKIQQPALWPQNAFHFLMWFMTWSRAKSSSEIESVNRIYVFLKTVTPIPSLP